MRAYNLCDAHHALLNVSMRRMKISRVADLNDPFELLAYNLRDKQLRALVRSVRDTIHRSNGVLCFSKSWSNPVLWSHYADKHRGICLGFDVADNILEPITYVNELTKLAIDSTVTAASMEKLLNSQFMCTKFIDWRYEEEVRAFVKLDHSTPESGLYFMDFSNQLKLREVILGPRCDVPISRVRDLVSAHEDVHVIKSRIAFTKFRVVEDRTFRRSNA